MAKYEIRETIEYWAEGIEAESEEEAHRLYLLDQDSYYYGVLTSKVTLDEEDED